MESLIAINGKSNKYIWGFLCSVSQKRRYRTVCTVSAKDVLLSGYVKKASYNGEIMAAMTFSAL